MLTSGGTEIANWGGQRHDGRSLYEPVNLILVDRSSTTAEQAAGKLNNAIARAGFPAQFGHSMGFSGRIGPTVYGQRPDTLFSAYRDANCLLAPNNHGRVFGPARAADGAGFVWSAAFSRERLDLYQGFPAHVYESFTVARDAVYTGLLATGARDLGQLWLGNVLNEQTVSTGDHDGYAAAVELE
jgi:hypothetical protein